MTDRPEEWDDNPEWTAADFARARPSAELLGEAVARALTRQPFSLSAYLASQKPFVTSEKLAA